MHVHDQILAFLKATGPTLPTKAAKNIKSDILIASAHLSDLSSQGKVKISKLKVGGSPLYYLPGQEDQLYKFVQGNINPKDFWVLQQLKEKKVFRENDLDLLSKVAVRHIPDFAIPLHVRIAEKVEIFWKWHLLSDEETNKVIGEILQARMPQPEQEEIVPEEISEIQKEEELPPVEELEEELTEEEKSELEKSLEDQKEVEIEAAQVVEKKPEPEESKVEETVKPKEEKVIETKEDKPTKKEEIKPDKPRINEEQKKLSEDGPKKSLLEKVKDKIKRKVRRKVPDTFLPVVEDFFKKIDIDIEKKETIRKNAELNFMVKVSSVVGTTTYFCKAKNKLKCDEKDLSTAYMEAQIKKLPLPFLYTNEINKNAQEMLNSGAFENCIVKKIE